MGGRGASSGISKKRNVYGSQFHAVKDSNGKALVSGNVKLINRIQEIPKVLWKQRQKEGYMRLLVEMI